MRTEVLAYFDCNATTLVEPAVAEIVWRFVVEEFGNAGSRTHEYGTRAKQAVATARAQVADLVEAEPTDVVFTSGATESNNLAILGIANALRREGRTHVLTSVVEHKAVLEPMQRLAQSGIDVEYLRPDEHGRISAEQVHDRLRDDTGLVSIMHVNNETGVIHPISELAKLLEDHPSFFHVDAAQGFGKLTGLESPRIDLISISGHKLYAPKGVGALIVRRHGMSRVPLEPLMIGGGQERGLRPGTLPVHLIAGLGEAARLAGSNREDRETRCLEIRSQLLEGFRDLPHFVNGDPENTIPSTLNIAFRGVDAEAAIVCLKGIVAISNGAACTSSTYSVSHVLQGMGLPEDRIRQSLRWSWSHMTPDPPIDAIRGALRPLIG